MAERAQAARSAQTLAAHDAERALQLAAVTERGTVRAENQDAVHLAVLEAADGCVLVLADGMGGHPDGRLAASLAVEAVSAHLAGLDDPAASLAEAVAAANAAIRAHAAPDERGRSLGTTLVAAVVCAGRATVANVGDSRAYLVRVGVATQLSVDHSWVAEQVRAGLLSEAEAQRHPRRSRITRALLGDPVDPDLFEVNLRDGDQVLLCSDGLWDVLGAERIAAMLDPAVPLETALDTLVDAALREGSTDNVTAAAVRVGAAAT